MDRKAHMEILPDGRLTYTIDAGNKLQIIKLTFEVKGDRILTNQPSDPRPDEARFSLNGPTRLVLERAGLRSWFERT